MNKSSVLFNLIEMIYESLSLFSKRKLTIIKNLVIYDNQKNNAPYGALFK